MNTLYYGDNLDVLRRHVADESVDLVYLDPPFNSNANYNVLFEEKGAKAAAQIQAFTDTWEWTTEAAAAYEEVVETGGEVANAMRAFRTLLGPSDMLAYLAMMAPRLVELRRVLKPTGSLYLHCDPTASHYLKLLLDAVFGPTNFRSEVIWKRTFAHNAAKRFGPVHDVIFYYVKTQRAAFNRSRTGYSQAYIDSHFRNYDDRGRFRPVVLTGPGIVRDGDSGKPWRDYDPAAVGRHWQPATYVYTKYRELTGEDLASYPLLERFDKLEEIGLLYRAGGTGVPNYRFYLDDAPGVALQDIWDDLPPVNSQSKERLGWETQKPIRLLERIIESSSDPDDVVLDPFCGCGTAIDAAEALGRRWIGIDITHLAIGLIKHRLVDRHGPAITSTYRVVGEPTTVEDAAVLAREDPFQFQAWALGLVGARVATSDKKGGDRGIDGRLFFHDSPGGDTRQIVISVKAGKLVPNHLRDLRGVIDREEAQIGVLLSFEEPTSGMRTEAASAGFYESPWGKHPRLQMLTVGQLLDGRGIDYPHVAGSNVTHRRAARAKQPTGVQTSLFEAGPAADDDV